MGLEVLRKDNFRHLVQRLKTYKDQDARLLEVGAAHGWFLSEAGKVFEVMGVEPDQAVFDHSDQRDRMRFGYFPDALEADERFDIIVFNDVFEHIPDLTSVLNACHSHLTDNGLLLINLPSSSGLFYRLSRTLQCAGLAASFERLWQKDMPSPHVHYFSPDNLDQLVSRFGFTELERGALPTLRLKGLATRISYAGERGRVANAALTLAVASAIPLLRVLPKDITYSIYQKSDRARSMQPQSRLDGDRQ
ncbi:class I SAM-dependent methyltransferase [Pseudomonas saliphila]|uniref:class I SAM-dependent methyltransferase n=1 Tax=Pseudomonas saliphila TaxID=2586906 RepID=UPI0015B57824|nr:class I SAM-dependent methyltransferase [Pseudomonas saliphila]